MEKVTELTLEPLTEKSAFVKPHRLNYKQDGVSKIWDMIVSRPSVAVIIFNTTRNCLVMVKQLRPACLVAAALRKNPDVKQIGQTVKGIDVGRDGTTIELCAGIVDKDKSEQEIAKMEILEECGYDVPLDGIKKVKQCLGSIGTSGETITLFYAEVTDAMRVSKGGGLVEEGEMIDVVEMTVQEMRDYVNRQDVQTPSFTLVGLMWFLLNKT